MKNIEMKKVRLGLWATCCLVQSVSAMDALERPERRQLMEQDYSAVISPPRTVREAKLWNLLLDERRQRHSTESASIKECNALKAEIARIKAQEREKTAQAEHALKLLDQRREKEYQMYKKNVNAFGKTFMQQQCKIAELEEKNARLRALLDAK